MAPLLKWASIFGIHCSQSQSQFDAGSVFGPDDLHPFVRLSVCSFIHLFSRSLARPSVRPSVRLPRSMKTAVV